LFDFHNWSLNFLGATYSTQLLYSKKLKNFQRILYSTKKDVLIKKTTNFLKLLDCYGELNLNN
jgi:hypothetical protein